MRTKLLRAVVMVIAYPILTIVIATIVVAYLIVAVHTDQ